MPFCPVPCRLPVASPDNDRSRFLLPFSGALSSSHYDMTQKERVECKALVAEAKRKTENSGEWNYKVRGPPGHMIIISVRRRPQ